MKKILFYLISQQDMSFFKGKEKGIANLLLDPDSDKKKFYAFFDLQNGGNVTFYSNLKKCCIANNLLSEYDNIYYNIIRTEKGIYSDNKGNFAIAQLFFEP